MTGPCFVDANVLVYSRDPADAVKQSRAQDWLDRLWSEGVGRISTQVLSEFYNVTTRKLAFPLTPDEAWADVEALFAWEPQAIDIETIGRAHQLEQRYRLSWWDSLIVAAAQAQHCLLLLSEDLQDGARYGGVTVRDPFRLSVAEAVAAYGEGPRPRYARRPSAMRARVL